MNFKVSFSSWKYLGTDIPDRETDSQADESNENITCILEKAFPVITDCRPKEITANTKKIVQQTEKEQENKGIEDENNQSSPEGVNPSLSSPDNIIPSDILDQCSAGTSTVVTEAISNPKFTCPFCSEVLPLSLKAVTENRIRFLKHLIQCHLAESLFQDIKEGAVSCKFAYCNFSALEKLDYFVHLSEDHQEFIERLDLQIQKLNVQMKGLLLIDFENGAELQILSDIR